MNFQPRGFNKGKVVYWIDGQRFENSKDKRDGKQRAEEYCLNNFLNPSDIQKFDSRTECNRYEYLLRLQSEGKIKNLAHHFTIKIQDEFVNANGDNVPPITYEADFIYQEEDGRRVVEDVKGSEYFIDERFITIKQVFDNIMKDKGLYIRVVLYRANEWVEWHIGEAKKSQKLIHKQREQIKEQKEALHKAQIENNAIARLKNRYVELEKKCQDGSITKSQAKRYVELKEILSTKGVIIGG